MFFESYDKYASVVIILFIGFAFVLSMVLGQPNMCSSYSTVVDIVSVQYRSVEVLLDTGSVHTINQPIELITNGSKICTGY